MTRGRLWTVAGVIAAAVAAILVAVLGWGADSLEQVSFVTSILGLAASVVIAMVSQGGRQAGRSGAARRRQWDRPPISSGAGAVLGLGALGVVLIAVMVLGTIAILAR